MVPLLAAVPAIASLAGGLMKVLGSNHSSSKASEQVDFDRQLDTQVQRQNRLHASDPTHAIQTMIAMQQSGGPLPVEQQMMLARQLLGRAVQVQAPGGGMVTGVVTNLNFQGGQVQLLINGRSYPVSSVQALLNGVGYSGAINPGFTAAGSRSPSASYLA